MQWKLRRKGGKVKYQLITDATADLAEDMLRQVPNLKIIPMEVVLNDTVRSYGPGGDLGVEEFYDALRSGGRASTSQINEFTYWEVFEEYLTQGMDVLYLCFSSGLSATWQNACTCAEGLREKYPERRVCCVDTLSASIGQGLLVYEAALRQQEGMELEELADWVEGRRMDVAHWFTVDSLEHLKRGGRINAATAAVGTVLHIKPLLRVDEEGKLVLSGKPRGSRQAMEYKLNKMELDWDFSLGQTVVVGHGGSPQEAEELKTIVEERFPWAHCHIAPIGPVIGSHTGPGMQALVFWGIR